MTFLNTEAVNKLIEVAKSQGDKLDLYSNFDTIVEIVGDASIIDREDVECLNDCTIELEDLVRYRDFEKYTSFLENVRLENFKEITGSPLFFNKATGVALTTEMEGDLRDRFEIVCSDGHTVEAFRACHHDVLNEILGTDLDYSDS